MYYHLVVPCHPGKSRPDSIPKDGRRMPEYHSARYA